MKNLDKKSFYLEIEKIRCKYNLKCSSVNFRDLCNKLEIQVGIVPFET